MVGLYAYVMIVLKCTWKMKNTSHCWNYFLMTYYKKFIYTLFAFVIISLVRPKGRKKAEKRPKTDLGRLRENVIFFFPRGEKQMTVCCCCLLSVLLCCTLLLFSKLVDSRMASVQSPSASKPKGQYCCVPGWARDRHLSFYRFPKQVIGGNPTVIVVVGLEKAIVESTRLENSKNV